MMTKYFLANSRTLLRPRPTQRQLRHMPRQLQFRLDMAGMDFEHRLLDLFSNSLFVKTFYHHRTLS